MHIQYCRQRMHHHCIISTNPSHVYMRLNCKNFCEIFNFQGFFTSFYEDIITYNNLLIKSIPVQFPFRCSVFALLLIERELLWRIFIVSILFSNNFFHLRNYFLSFFAALQPKQWKLNNGKILIIPPTQHIPTHSIHIHSSIFHHWWTFFLKCLTAINKW